MRQVRKGAMVNNDKNVANLEVIDKEISPGDFLFGHYYLYIGVCHY